MKLAKYSKSLMIIFLILIFIIPSCCGANETSDDSVTADSIGDEDVLSSGNDYFFNASLEDDGGDGSLQNPYKYLKADRIKSNCNIYLADGEYNLDEPKTIERVSITGSDPTKTVIRYDGVGFNVNSFLSLTNVTLIDFSITNHGNVDAENTIFDCGYGSKADSYGNNYGGAIYTDNENANAKVTLTNCTFTDCFAIYGGAIYMGAGYLTVSDSRFIGNCAYNFGGAIACENTMNVSVFKSKFISNRASDDAGGAIYIKSSPFSIERSDIVNCSATFGGAIALLDSDVKLKSLNAHNNSAIWDGGAIYHMYGKFSSTFCEFINNSARNGGAIYIDNSSDLFIVSNSFEANRANVSAGAIFSILNNLRVPLSSNAFKSNVAPEYRDYFDTKNLNVDIGGSDYSIYSIDDEGISEIPANYSLVDEGLVSRVKDQQSSGNCWAFTAMAVLESCLKKITGKEFDLSEENMKNLIALFSDYGWKMVTNEGGYDAMPFGYFASWLGPVDEMSDVFDDKSVLSPVLDSMLHIQNILFLKRDNFTDNDAIKRAIMKYGAVGTSIYFDTYYLNNGRDYFTWALYPSNHAVTIVGWDDSYSRENFYFGSYAAGDGAWIVKNSWGPSWGDNGYFYVSYYDESFAKPGVEGIAYTFILNDTVRYDRNYQYDIAGKTDYLHDNRLEVWYKNSFTAKDNEILAGVSTYFEKLTNWTVSVYVNDVLRTTKSGMSEAGYYTIQLDDTVALYAGDVFEIVFNTTCEKFSGVPISEIASLNKAIFYPGISYVSYDGENWEDLFYLTKTYALHTYKSQVACIKAFTILTSYNTTTSIAVDGGNVTVKVTDQFGNPVLKGKITLDGKTYDLADGNVTMPIPLSDGIYNFTAAFEGTGYGSSQNSTVFEVELKIDLPSDVHTYNSDYRLVLHDQFGRVMSAKSVIFNLTNKRFEKESDINGEISFNLDLNVGTYPLAIVNPKTNESIVHNIRIVPRLSDNRDIVMYFAADRVFVVKVHDDFGNALSGEPIQFIVDGKKYTANTDGDGFASIKLNKFNAKTYRVTISYKGYCISNKITVKPTLTAKNKSFKKGKTIKFTAKLVNTKGKPLKGKKITFKLKGKKYSAKTNKKGIAKVTIKRMKVGKYTIQTSYKNMKIKNRISVKR